MPKPCNTKSSRAKDPEYVCNPVTGRWVKKSGKVGQALSGKPAPTKPAAPSARVMKQMYFFNLSYIDRIPDALAEGLKDRDHTMELLEEEGITDKKTRAIVDRLLSLSAPSYGHGIAEDEIIMNYIPAIKGLYITDEKSGMTVNDVLGNKKKLDPKLQAAFAALKRKYHTTGEWINGVLTDGFISDSNWKDLEFCGFFGTMSTEVIQYDDDKVLVVLEYDNESG